jgi:hypothetical protein
MYIYRTKTPSNREQQIELEATSETAKLPWVRALAAQPGMREVLVPGQQLRKHPVGQLVSQEDHLVRGIGIRWVFWAWCGHERMVMHGDAWA